MADRLDILDFVHTKPLNRDNVKKWVKAFLSFDIQDERRCQDEDHNFIHDTQLDYVAGAFLNEYSSCVLMAARYGGKSYAAAVVCFLDCWFKPGIIIGVAAYQRDQSDFIYVHIKTLIARFEKAIGKKIAKVSKDEVVFNNGSSVSFFSGGKSSANVKGFHPHVLIVDEADLFKAATFDGIANSLDAGGLYDRRLDVLSTNYQVSGEGVILKQIERYELWNKTKQEHAKPRRVFRICLIDFLQKCESKYKCFDEKTETHCPLWQWCKGRAKEGEGYYAVSAAIESLGDQSSQRFEAEMLLLRPTSEFAYFHNFDAKKNILYPDGIGDKKERELDPTLKTFIAFDGGGSRCPHAAVVMQMTNETTPRWIVLDNFTMMDFIEDLIADVKRKYPQATDFTCFCDPNMVKKENNKQSVSNYQILRQHGFCPRKKDLKREHGFEIMFNLISPANGIPRLLINSRCKQLISEIYAAESKLVRGAPVAEAADMANVRDDCLDCTRYILTLTCGSSYGKHNGNDRLRFF